MNMLTKSAKMAILFMCIGLVMSGCGTKGAKEPISCAPLSDPPIVEKNIVELDFPAYQDGKDEFNSMIYETAPFKVSMEMPTGWSVKLPEQSERVFKKYAFFHSDFYTAVNIYDGDKLVAFIGYNIFDPYFEENQDEIAPEDYYMTVYPSLRLGSMYYWDPHTAVKTTEFGDTRIATVEYLDPDEIDNHPGAMPDVPHIITQGILSYDKNMGVYIGIQFEGDSGVSDEQLHALANSISLSFLP